MISTLLATCRPTASHALSGRTSTGTDTVRVERSGEQLHGIEALGASFDFALRPYAQSLPLRR